MDSKGPATLFALATQSLLNNEPIAIHILQKIPNPNRLFIPLFNAAFIGGHKDIIMAMVKIWPYPCLHMGTLNVRESQPELMKVIIESFQVLPTQDSASWTPKLRILDLREDAVYRTVCDETSSNSQCFHSCPYSGDSAPSTEGSSENAQSEVQSSIQSLQLIVDLSVDGALKKSDFLSLLVSKVEQSLGSLHLCSRDLQIDKLCNFRNILKYLNLKCVNHLAIDKALLSEVTKILSKTVQLDILNLSKITCTSFNGKGFKKFTTQLRRMSNLKDLTISSFCLTDHLGSILRVLPPNLDFLSLTLCGLSNSDFTFLSQCPQTNCLKLLNLSHNRIYWGDCEPLRDLLERVSGTLMHLNIDHCLLTDSTMSIIIPALSHCSQLRVFSFTYNPVTMSMLTRILNNITPLIELKYVIYPVPVHCVSIHNFQSRLNRRLLSDVQAQVRRLLDAAQRNNMKWITYDEYI